MSKATLKLRGRFQCRLAVNPDPFDEPAGLRGTTIILPGEPYFDRVVRTTPRDACTRSHCLEPEVRLVTADAPFDGWVAGAVVSLEPGDRTGGPFFDEWSGIKASQRKSPLSVVDLRIQFRDGSVIGRAAKGDVETGPVPDEVELIRLLDEFMAPDASELTNRKASLQMEIDDLTRHEPVDPEALLRLQTRLALLGRSFGPYTTAVSYRCDLTEKAEVPDVDAEPWRRIDSQAHWQLSLLFSRWDFDSMSGAIAGSLTLPLTA